MANIIGDEMARREQLPIVTVERTGWDPLWRYDDPVGKIDHWMGYCPQTCRVVDLAYHRGSPAEDRQARSLVLEHLTDQPPDRPRMWSFFDVSFVVPPGFIYDEAEMNVGDMWVEFDAADGRGSLTVRQIYPAKLALKRQSLGKWLGMLLDERIKMYSPRATRAARNRHEYDSLRTLLGGGVVCDARLRLLLRPFRWRLPRLQRTQLIHDTRTNRLVALRLTARPERIDEWFNLLHHGMHWARPDIPELPNV